jgi:hypothetical protein
MAGKLSAVYGGPANGIHIGEATDPYGFGPTVKVTLCGIGRNPLLEIFWKMTRASEVTCKDCFEKAKAMHDGQA